MKTRFSRYQTENDGDIEGAKLSPIFPKIGHLIGSKKKRKRNIFLMDLQLCSEAHRYSLFNTKDEQVEAFIM